ncbi:MAG: hypothetical protein H0X46_06780 [Bacteroidetes bacterium]|nr:hypothetical protein [Bacteroidota bacterium]
MKKIKLILSITSLLFCSYSNSQTQILTKYSGPKDKAELTIKLNTSQNPAILSINQQTKQSIIDHLVFINGHPKGMTGTDQNIQNLYASNAEAVFTAIFGCRVVMCNFETKPVVVNITYEDFVEKSKTAAFRFAISYCENCDFPELMGDCCRNHADGCSDEIFISNNVYYHIK